MKKFLLLIREDLERMKNMTEAEMQADIAKMTRWAEQLAASGNLLGGEPLEADVRYVKKAHIATDGPFAESRESVTGYMLIQAESLEEAAALAAACPSVTDEEIAIEVRPLMVHE
ncbi:YciI family protein [Chitinophaga sp. 22620]|uniref:YciI family protein n=1 Tax=Chitinophaga sp. 22620 TaxID=3453952 RepID=UPI003F86B626